MPPIDASASGAGPGRGPDGEYAGEATQRAIPILQRLADDYDQRAAWTRTPLTAKVVHPDTR
ncbi:MAG: hypothetical protein ACR2OB_11130 [Solirubrobacteraceae bacterium]